MERDSKKLAQLEVKMHRYESVSEAEHKQIVDILASLSASQKELGATLAKIEGEIVAVEKQIVTTLQEVAKLGVEQKLLKNELGETLANIIATTQNKLSKVQASLACEVKQVAKQQAEADEQVQQKFTDLAVELTASVNKQEQAIQEHFQKGNTCVLDGLKQVNSKHDLLLKKVEALDSNVKIMDELTRLIATVTTLAQVELPVKAK